MRKTKKPKTSPEIIIFFTIITSIIVISISISRYKTTVALPNSIEGAKWDIQLNTNYNDYVLFENNKENQQEFTITVKSESEVSTKYDLEIKGLYKQYKAKIEKEDYTLGYSFNENMLNIETNGDNITFNLDKNNQSITVSETEYYMEKYTTGGNTEINITNKTLDKSIVNILINKDEQIDVILKNCKEFWDCGKHEDEYNLRISTDANILPAECNIKVYALFEQID